MKAADLERELDRRGVLIGNAKPRILRGDWSSDYRRWQVKRSAKRIKRNRPAWQDI